MGLYDNLHKINTTLSSERVEKQKERERKKLLKQLQDDFKAELLELLILLYLQKSPIYTNEARYKNIEIIIQNYIEKNKEIKEFWIFQKFIPYYKNDIVHYLHNNYYTIASKGEKIAKKRIDFELQDVELQEIEFEKQQKELARKQKEAEKIEAEKQKQKAIYFYSTTKVIETIFTTAVYIFINIIIAFISLGGGFVGGMIKGSLNTKKW